MSYLDAQDLPVPTPPPYQVGRYGMYEMLDAAAIGRALLSRRRPDGPVLKPWLAGDKALFWWSDPMPAVGALGQLVNRRLGRALDRVRRAPAPVQESGDASNPAVTAR